MINLKEFRIDNWYRRIHGKGFTDQQIDLSTLGMIMGDDLNIAFDDFNHIELTPEWLESFGLIKSEENLIGGAWYVEPQRHHIVLRDGKFIYRVPGNSLIEVKWVHQLQNIFHSLTGAELIIKHNVQATT